MVMPILKSLAPTLVVLLAAAPAQAQIHVAFGGVRIHIAPDAPPPPRLEYRLAQPSYGHVWIPGYWDRRDDRWFWCGGRWAMPAAPGACWVQPRYLRQGVAYRYEPGYWSRERRAEHRFREEYRREERGREGGHGPWHRH